MTDLEIACRAYCEAYGIDPDKESVGLGVHMPAGERYRFWEAQKHGMEAVLAALERT